MPFKMLLLNVIYLTLTVGFVIIKDEKVENVKSCVQQAIKNIFAEDDTLLFIFDDVDRYIFSYNINNPSIIIDMSRENKFVNETSIGHHQNYVIHARSYITLLLTLNKLHVTKIWKNNKMPLRKVLFVTPIFENETFSKVIRTYWAIKVLNLVILTYDLNKKDTAIRLMVSDPQAVQNQCQRTANLINTYSCNESNVIKFPRILRKYENCFLTIHSTLDASNKHRSRLLFTTAYILETIREYLNMSITLKKQTDAWFQEDLFRLMMNFYNDVPAPKRIPQMETLKLVFKQTVWIFILVSFILTSVMLWCINKYAFPSNQHSLGYYFLEVYSITIFGTTTSKRLLPFLQFIFISYVIYSIHIQAVFTGKLITLLTIPQFEHQIKSLQELSESNNSIVTYMKTLCFDNPDKNEGKIYRKIKTKFICYSNEDYRRLISTEEATINYTILVDQDVFQQLSGRLKRKSYYFVDNSFLGITPVSFTIDSFSYFTVTLNEIIIRLIESGLLKQLKARYDCDNTLYRTVSSIENQKLSLKHLYPIFVFWVFGLSLSFVVFAGELLVSTIKQKFRVKVTINKNHMQSV
ncbi:hypothetical protein RN001_011350 [Aquatica leii]|uniref:Ionotropic glutamate receptor C-terminal domain-containing protein n=1 Tax=Aquatica leii TaxID=1421715 RepID=A0AAN7P7Y5_9COLE|nr:hypothetical protein RN001_011350 [Aquatica leii]